MPQMTIGKLARAAGIGIDTIRFYEREALIPPPARTAAGYRLYRTEDSRRLRFVRRAKELGFSLAEIRDLLFLADGAGSKQEVKTMTRDKLAQIESQIADLTRIQAVLSTLEARCSGRGGVHNCPIIESLNREEDSP